MTAMGQLLANRKALVGLCILALFGGLALIGPALVGDPSDFVAVPLLPPSAAHWFGTTGQGQDVFAQTVAGARGTLAVAFLVGLTVLLLGALVGTVAGYFGGWIDEGLGLLVNLFLLIPGLPLAVVIAAYLPAGPGTITLVLVLTGWAWTARVIRASALSLRQADFVSAAMVSGESHLRVILFEILPNMLPLLASSFIAAVTYAIGAEVGLEFLGLGDLERVSWGTNLYWASNDVALPSGSWWTFVPTGVAIALVGFALALLNNGLDQFGNPQLDPERAFLRATGRKRLELSAATPVLRKSQSHG
ncbi:MAG TPA: ABC transporter permease [Polyangia bacterium]|nr:ABC transporter permease [Polyangia bacterium]